MMWNLKAEVAQAVQGEYRVFRIVSEVHDGLRLITLAIKLMIMGTREVFSKRTRA